MTGLFFRVVLLGSGNDLLPYFSRYLLGQWLGEAHLGDHPGILGQGMGCLEVKGKQCCTLIYLVVIRALER